MAEFFNTFGENVMKLLTSVHWYDVLDIITITLIIYYCIKLFRQTRAIHLVRGIVLISLIYLLVSALNMSTSKFVFSKLFDDIVIVLVLLFQPEIRHAIESFGRGDFKKFTLFSKNSELTKEQLRASASAIAKAASNMSDTKTGALIVIEGKSPLGEIIATGSPVDAQISIPVIENIFYPKAPLHDGAMIIRNNRINSAGCILPLTQTQIGRELGTRHRAAVGMSEHSDALVIVVSEETGRISVAKDSVLSRNVSQGELLEKLMQFLITDDSDKKSTKKNRRRKEADDER